MDGDAILFAGAGLSFLSENETGGRLPDGSQLVDLLLEQAPGTGARHKLDRVAGSVLRSRQGAADFIFDVVQKNFTVKKIDPRLSSLYLLPWKRIYTTNYDNAAEVARSGVFPVSSITMDDQQRDAAIGSIVHLNGYVKRVSPATLNRDLLLTDTSYAASRLIQTGWLSFFERDVRSCRAIIFAGYSLYDLDIERILFGSEGVGEKIFFFISPSADKIEVDTLSEYGEVVQGGIDALVETIAKVQSSYEPPRFPAGLTCLRELVPGSGGSSEAPSAQRLFNQLVFGILPEQEVLEGAEVFPEQSYLVRRSQDIEAVEALRRGPARDLLYVGEMASGKSASTLTMAAHLRSQGYRVFYAEKGEALLLDLVRVSDSQEKIAIIFDGYSIFRPEITDYVRRRPSYHRVILTERAHIHELVGKFIDETPHLGPVHEVALDRISPADTPAFEALTNFGGFWGDRAGASVGARQRYIADNLESSLHRLLLEIIKSEKVQNQIRELLKPISMNVRAAKILCCALIVNVLRFDFTISEWQYFFDRNSIRLMLNSYGEHIGALVSSSYDKIYVRNGILSIPLIQAFADNELVRESLESLYEFAERSSSSPRWRALTVQLMKFSSIEPMFSGPTKSQHIFKYYDRIRVFGSTRDNPDYWLQLGIAATVLDDLARGPLCFENAYARERARPKADVTRIDNYSARFDMKRAVAESNPDAAFELFISANNRLIRQIFLDINMHYPFKTGRQFSDIAAKHYDTWNDDQKEKFRDAAKKIRDKAMEWKSSSKHFSMDVDILIKETADLLKRLGGT